MMQRHCKYHTTSVKHKAIDQRITNLLVCQMLPATLVDSEEWRDLWREVEPRFDCPGRRHYSNTAIPGKYARVKEAIMTDLKHIQGLSCTTDGWSSLTGDPYVSLTVHFMTPQWELRTYCLRTIYMPESHTGENVAQMLKTILGEYNLRLADVTTFTTDNGSNMKVAIRNLKLLRIPCFGHILHNAINNAIKNVAEVTSMLSACRTVVSTLNHSFR